MGFRTGGLLALAAITWAAEAGAAQTPETLAPSGKWFLDYAPDSCLLARQFGAGSTAVLAQFIRYEPQERLTLNLIGRSFANVVDQSRIELRFGTTGAFVRRGVQAGTAQFGAEKTPAIFLSTRLDNLDSSPAAIRAAARAGQGGALTEQVPVSPALEAAVTSLTLRLGGRTVVLDLGSMGAPMAAMRQCPDNLVRHWGFNPAEQAALASRPRPLGNPGAWVTSGDYPTFALATGQQALIFFRLAVDSSGAVSGCSIQSALASSPDFARKTCELIQRRARFEPARTIDGRAVASYYINRVHWIIPNRR